MFEAHEDWDALSVDFSILHHRHHAVAVHRLSCEELEVLKPRQHILHDGVHVRLEDVHLIRSRLLELLHNLLHVVLEVRHVPLLVPKSRLHEAMVQDNVHPTLDIGVRPSIPVLPFRRGVGSVQLDVLAPSLDKLPSDFVHDLVNQLDLVGVREHFVSGEDVLVDPHDDDKMI